MTPRQIDLVRTTFGSLAPRAAEVASTFYARLFQRAPSLRPLFRGDLQAQGSKLMQALVLAVGSLEELDAIRPQLAELGRRHDAYGVRAEDYATVAGALMETLEAELRAAFTSEVRAAWGAAYDALAQAMQQRESVALPLA